MKPENIDTIIAIAILVIAWINIIRYMKRKYNQPCKWRIKYWR